MNLSLTLALVLTSALSCIALAGPSGSGGGRGVVCRDANHKILSVELLDLWEAEHIRGYKIAKSSKLAMAQVDAAINVLKDVTDDQTYGYEVAPNQDIFGSPALAGYLRHLATDFAAPTATVHRQHGISLSPTSDSNEIEVPSENSDCRVTQLVTYLDSNPNADGGGEIFINQDLVDKMDATNQAALYVHEIFYRVLRNWYNEPNSIRVRRAVGYIFSGHTFTPVSTILPSTYVACRTPHTEVDLYQSSSSSLTPYSVILRDESNVPTMGTPALQNSYGSRAIAALLSGETTYPDDAQKTMTRSEIFSVHGAGMIDYDQSYGTFVLTYYDGQIQAYLTPKVINRGAPVDLAGAIPLTCTLEKK